jgi:cystine transport system substrate-binding protein
MRRLTVGASLLLTLALTLAAGCSTAPKSPTPAPAQADTSLTSVQQKGKLLIGMSGQYPPFAYRESSGKLIGFDVDITTEIAKRLKVQPEYVTMPFAGLIAALDSSRFDVIANQMGITEARLQRYAFTTPYVQSGAQLLVNKENKVINGLADVKGKTFGASQGSNYETILLAAGAKVEHYTSNATLFSDIASGRIDGTMDDRLQNAYLIKTSTQPFRPAGSPGEKVPVAIMSRKDSTALVSAINTAFADMKADGTFVKISNQWFGEDVSK